jgi:serine/threonine protein kinase
MWDSGHNFAGGGSPLGSLRDPIGAPALAMAEGQAASKASSAVDPLIGRSINDRFKITGLIARGGMGKVYRAEQAPLGRLCAVKILNPNYAGEQDPEFHKRFFLEASIASKLTHPNTVTIFDYGRTDDDIYYMAMELLEGVTLHRAIRESGRLLEDRVAHIARQICRALREAHALGVIHRDLKPANIFLVNHGDESDFVKVLDFGLVKNVLDPKPEDQLTQTGLFMGSPKYMAPEQVRGDKVDHRTDVYSLGIMMYEMLTGKVPFDRPNSLNILMAQVNDDAPPMRVMNANTDVGPVMEELVAHCLAKDPDARCGSMDEVLATLKRIGGRFGVTGTGEFRPSEYPAGMANNSGPHSSPHANASGSMPIPASGLRPSQTPSVGGALPGRSAGDRSGPLSKPRSVPPSNPQPPSAISSQQVALPLVTRHEPSATPPPTVLLSDPRRGTKIVAAIVVLVAAALGVLIVLSLRPSSDEATAAPAAADPAVTPAVVPPRAAAAAPPSAGAPQTVEVTALPSAAATPSSMSAHITSDPAGAVVKEDGKEVCAATPCDHDFGADFTKEHKLVFYKAGFRLETRVVHAGDTPVAVHFVRAPAWAPPASQPAKPAEPSAPTPQGFKEIPY